VRPAPAALGPYVAAALGIGAMSLVVAGLVAGASSGGRPPLERGESYGIDVASYQGQVAWSTVVGDGISFAYIKATQGATYVNPYFASDWQGATSSGVAHGAYEFFSLCSPGSDQAQFFLGTVPQDPSALPPAVDLELKGNCAHRPAPSSVSRQLSAFVAAVEASTGKTVVFYVGRDFAARYSLAIVAQHPQWLRRVLRPTARSVVVWQTGAPVRVSGVTGDVDLDLASLSVLRAAGRGRESEDHRPEDHFP
jgi:lysozyme